MIENGDRAAHKTVDASELDIYSLLMTLWNGRYFLLVIPVLAAIVTFLLSSLVIPAKFSSTAFVTVRDPIGQLVELEGLMLQPAKPDTVSVSQLALAPGLLESVLASPSIDRDSLTQGSTASDIFDVQIAGNNQLQLTVTSRDPVLSAEVASTWASSLTRQVNTSYGLADLSDSLDQKYENAIRDLEDAEDNLERVLEANNAATLKLRLGQAQDEFDCALDKRHVYSSLLEDLQGFHSRVEKRAEGARLPLGDNLELITLQRRALSSESCQMFEDNMPNFELTLSEPSITAAETLGTVEELQVILREKQDEIQARLGELEGESRQLAVELAAYQSELDQVTLDYDRSKDIVNVIDAERRLIKAVPERSYAVAIVSASPVVPRKASSPRTAINTALGGVVGAAFSLTYVLAAEWWRHRPGEDVA